MHVHVDGKTYSFEHSMTVKEILKKLGLNQEIYLVILEDGNLATPDRVIGKDDTIKIIRVVSGG
ncbi:MAG: MoaD/ThiS family protein [Proteobacteria bacterium]|nr:MoaD/ThiS family protein [Pseudomonadota bacterium]